MAAKAVYLVYVILPVLLLWGAKLYGKGQWNEEALSLRQTKALQGFLAICVMLHHVGQKTCAPWLWPASRIIHGLDLFVPIGYLLVAVFLFFNGYGVYKSFHTKENYLKGFFGKRILPILLAWYVTGIIFLAARLLLKEKIDPTLFFCYLSGIKLCNPNTWYVIALPVFYLGFYAAFRLFRRDWAAVTATCLVVLAYITLGTYIDHNDWWMRGEWWYNCAHMFCVGILFAKYEKQILAHFRKHYLIWLLASVALLYPLYMLTEYTQNVFSYYVDGLPVPEKMARRWVTLASQMAMCIVFTLAVLLPAMKIRIGNAFLKFMGAMTLEFYLIHGLFVELFDHKFDGGVSSPWPVKNVALYVLAVFVLSVQAAWLLKHALAWLRKKMLDDAGTYRACSAGNNGKR